MGFGTIDEHRNKQLRTALGIIDREIGAPSNRYIVKSGALSAIVPRQGYIDLQAAATQSRSAFNVVAAAVLPFWAGLGMAAQDDQFGLHAGVVEVEHWVERERISPPFYNRGPDTSAQDELSLETNAQLGQPAFVARAAVVLGQWWGGLPAVDRDSFFFNYRDT